MGVHKKSSVKRSLRRVGENLDCCSALHLTWLALSTDTDADSDTDSDTDTYTTTDSNMTATLTLTLYEA